MSKKPIATLTPKVLFLHLLSLVMLYLVAIHIGILLYQITNLSIPDPLTDYTYSSLDQYQQPLRWAVATLIVTFPVYVWTRMQIAKQKNTPPKLIVWLTYVTIFIASLIIIGDIIAVLNQFMQGELTTRFGLKVLAIFAIASSVIFYYTAQLKHTVSSSILTWFARSATALIVLCIGIGLFLAGSPQAERSKRIDEKRVQQLQLIQQEIINYWQSKDELPQTLDQLNDGISYPINFSDPITQSPYEYQVLTDLSFQLCATFDTASTETAEKPRVALDTAQIDNWYHDQGYVCFSRDIDPQRYQPINAKEIPQISPQEVPSRQP